VAAPCIRIAAAAAQQQARGQRPRQLAGKEANLPPARATASRAVEVDPSAALAAAARHATWQGSMLGCSTGHGMPAACSTKVGAPFYWPAAHQPAVHSSDAAPPIRARNTRTRPQRHASRSDQPAENCNAREAAGEGTAHQVGPGLTSGPSLHQNRPLLPNAQHVACSASK